MPYADSEKRRIQRRFYYTLNKEKRRIRAKKEWAARDPLQLAEYRRKRRYKFEPGQFQAIFDAQKGCCALCTKPLKLGGKYIHVDHCHETAVVRGLLCAKCNIALGNFDDSPARLKQAIEYLARGK